MWLPEGQFSSSTSADMKVCLSSDTHHSWAGTHGLREKCWCLLFTRNHNGALRLSPPTFEEALFWHSHLLSHSFRHHPELVFICKGGIKESATSLSLSPPLPSSPLTWGSVFHFTHFSKLINQNCHCVKYCPNNTTLEINIWAFQTDFYVKWCNACLNL